MKHEKIIAREGLFWFLKEGTELDLSRKDHLDMAVQQTLSRGRTPDVRMLFERLAPSAFAESFLRVKNFLPREVRGFWEEWLGDSHGSAKKGAPSI